VFLEQSSPSAQHDSRVQVEPPVAVVVVATVAVVTGAVIVLTGAVMVVTGAVMVVTGAVGVVGGGVTGPFVPIGASPTGGGVTGEPISWSPPGAGP
jgi:hypothetical protein